MRVLASLVGISIALVPAVAWADAKECIAASETGQTARTALKLSSAKIAFAQCASETCPAVIRKDCASQLGEVDAAIPTMVFGAKVGGRDLTATRVLVDGTVVAESLDGKALPFDPGAHVVRFEASGQAPVEKTVLLKQGEKNRSVDAEFGGAPTAGVGGATVPERAAKVTLLGKPGASPVLEMRYGNIWRQACTAPCGQPMALDREYRLNGDGTPTSVPFSLQGQPGDHVSLSIKEGDDGGRKKGLTVLAIGGGGIAVGVIVLVIGVVVGGAKEVVPFADSTRDCPADSSGHATLVTDSSGMGIGCQTKPNKGLGYALDATGAILGTAGLTTAIIGIAMLAGGSAEVTQTKMTALLGPRGIAF